MLRDAVAALRKGVKCDGLVVYASSVSPGRFAEERNVEIHVRSGKSDCPLMFAKVFYGRPPQYGPWVELFAINQILSLGRRKIGYFGSPVEAAVLSLLSRHMRRGQMFVEYNDDRVTKKQLQLSVPLAATRLGSILFGLGFCWFKDWYYPEGFMEGGMKLQGEKCAGASERKRHVRETMEELSRFLGGSSSGSPQVAAGRKTAASLMRSMSAK